MIDDHADAAEALALGLKLFGHRVRTAHDGLSGLETAAQFRPDVAIVDIALPVMNGWALAERLRALPLFEKVRLIALSGLCQPQHRLHSLAAGFERHLVKPISLRSLHEVLSRNDSGPPLAVAP